MEGYVLWIALLSTLAHRGVGSRPPEGGSYSLTANIRLATSRFGFVTRRFLGRSAAKHSFTSLWRGHSWAILHAPTWRYVTTMATPRTTTSVTFGGIT